MCFVQSCVHAAYRSRTRGNCVLGKACVIVIVPSQSLTHSLSQTVSQSVTHCLSAVGNHSHQRGALKTREWKTWHQNVRWPPTETASCSCKNRSQDVPCKLWWGRWKWRTWKWRTIEMSRHEIDGHENDGNENAGHVSGVWIRPTTLNAVECTVLFQRHLIFLDIHILAIFVDTWYSCVLVLGDFGYAFQLFYKLLRCCDLYSAVVLKKIAHCIVM